MATIKERCLMGFENGMMVAGRSVKYPERIIYVGFHEMKNSVGKPYFRADACKNDSTKKHEMKDLDFDTTPEEISEKVKHNLTVGNFSKAAKPFWKAYVNEEAEKAEQAALRSTRTTSSAGQRRISTKENRVTKSATKKTKSRTMVNHHHKKLGARFETFAMDCFDDVKMSLTATELDLVHLAMAQKYPADSYKPTTVDMLLALRNEAVEKGWLPSEHPALARVNGSD